MRKTLGTHSVLAGKVLHDRGGGLGQYSKDREQVSACPAALGPCVCSLLTLLFDLAGLLHHRTKLPLQTVVVVGMVLDLDVDHRLDSGSQKLTTCSFERGGTGVQWASDQASGAESPGSVKLQSSHPCDPPPLTTWVYSALVVDTRGSTPNSSLESVRIWVSPLMYPTLQVLQPSRLVGREAHRLP